MNFKQPFNQLDQKLSATIAVNESKYLYFGGTAYLGIPQNQEFIKRYMEGISRYGLNNGTSRGNNVQLGIYDEAEAFAAQKFGAQAALISSSGYLAAKLVVQHYAAFGNIRYAPNSHPAIWLHGDPENRLEFEDWSRQIVEEINSSKAEKWVLLSNSMNNLYPEIYDFSFISNINPDKKIVLIIDDSHGIGILNAGTGVFTGVPKLGHVELVVVASMAKALGLDAGVVLGSKQAIQELKQSDEFYGASPPAAAGLYALIRADEIYQKAYEKLQHNVKKFAELLPNQSLWHFVDKFPVFLCKQDHVERQLLEEKILISSFPYPDKNGKILNRIVLSSWHNDPDILKLISAL
ncbi:aminotransferase class I/II-fold pyridoxal phosphate-dependent enzyme [Pedobacter nanyangensis]|uniref:aminotransferase class I/II-fold pyridoxal phosphate-dependent enzyme n=1 Tax=Pedobacter nanyangensis TaxID=1562389 RepID=UPI000DE2D58A|nr:aminotransferase class I/II-fold pyridoxal phosphate-dependent enzyme [Pedobacter nanyangensis]